MPNVTCVECGASFHVPPCRTGARYCSWECRVAQPRQVRLKERQPWTCSVCGVLELKQPSEMFRKFCSTECRDVSVARNGSPMRKRIDVECRRCNKPLNVPPSVIVEGRGKFCSRRCAVLGRPLGGKPSAICSEAAALLAADVKSPLLVEEMRVGRWSIDIAYPLLMVAVEVDGTYWHSLPAMQERDRRKDADLAARGWRVVRVPVGRNSTPEDVAVAVRRHLKRPRRRRLK